MYIGISALKEIIEEDSQNLNWIKVEVINDNRSNIELSNGENYTTNNSIFDIFNMIKNYNVYAMPSLNDIVFSFLAINSENLTSIDDEYLEFNDNMRYENMYENYSIFIDKYELELEWLVH